MIRRCVACTKIEPRDTMANCSRCGCKLPIALAERYIKPDGTTEDLAGAALAGSLDVGGAALDQTLAATGSHIVNSRDGADVVCSFDTANSPASGVLSVRIVYQRD